MKASRVWASAFSVLVAALGLRHFARVPLFEFQKRILSSGQVCDLTPPAPSESVAVVVLGFSCNHRAATPSDPLKHRLAHAADVAVAARADTVVCSGGLDAGQVQTYPSEGEIMAAWMSALPVMQRARADPSSRLVVLPERKSVSTRENALFSLQLLAQQAPATTQVVVVTNQFHGSRSLSVFRKAAQELAGLLPGRDGRGVIVRMCEVPADVDSATLQIDFVRELFATLWYAFKGWLL